MDYIREFDIRLEKEMYYAGETLSGHVVLDTSENFKLRSIRVVLRGKAHTEWKVVVSGDRRTVKDDQYFIDDRTTIWGKEKAEGHVPILPRGMHQFPFKFQLPESSLPCSFESRAGTIRYYIKVTVDIPYASPPQGMKYFTIIGPHIDCMDDQYLKPMVGQAKRTTCCLCCERGPIALKTQLERSAYVCGESLRVKADIDNQTEEEARLKLKLVQYVEYYIDRGVLGVTKEVSHTILEYRGAPVNPHTRSKWDSQQTLVVSTMPPTLLGVCRLMQIYYLLKVNVELEKSGEDLHMHFPITIATVPFRIPNSQQQPAIQYEVASDHAEGGLYIGPEFQLGQVYDGETDTGDIVLYRPVYLAIKPLVTSSNNTGAGSSGSGGGGVSGSGSGSGGQGGGHLDSDNKDSKDKLKTGSNSNSNAINNNTTTTSLTIITSGTSITCGGRPAITTMANSAIKNLKMSAGTVDTSASASTSVTKPVTISSTVAATAAASVIASDKETKSLHKMNSGSNKSNNSSFDNPSQSSSSADKTNNKEATNISKLNISLQNQNQIQSEIKSVDKEKKSLIIPGKPVKVNSTSSSSVVASSSKTIIEPIASTSASATASSNVS